MIIANKLKREKGYSEKQAFELAHKVFENVEADKQYGRRTAEYFYNMILSNSEYIDTRKIQHIKCGGKQNEDLHH